MELDGNFPKNRISSSSVPSYILLGKMSSGGWFQGAALAGVGIL